MSLLELTNFGASKLAANILATDTTLNVTAGEGAKFPALATASHYFLAKIINSSKQAEIVKVTGRVGDQLTIARSQEGTTARAYSAGDYIGLILTAGTIDLLKIANPPAAKTADYTTSIDDNGGTHELSGLVATVTLGDAATLRPSTKEWTCRFKNLGTSNVTFTRGSPANTINRVAGDLLLMPGEEVAVWVNSAQNGFEASIANTATHVATGTDTYVATGLIAETGFDYKVTFTNANTLTNPTLNGTTIVKNGAAALVAGDIPAGHNVLLRKTATNFVLLNPTAPKIIRTEFAGAGTLDFGTVNAGDRILFSFYVDFHLTAGAGVMSAVLQKTAGTAAIQLLNGATSVTLSAYADFSVEGLSNNSLFATFVIKVTTGGTLTFGTNSLSGAGSGLSVTWGTSQTLGVILNNG